MTTTKLTGSSMEGTINAQENGLFYTSVPYEAVSYTHLDVYKRQVMRREISCTAPVGRSAI